jgi:chaperonin cofactor prefoldin
VKGESQTIFDEISSSDATDEVKNQAERLKNNIDNYIKEIEAMKEEIYKHVPEDDNN